MSEIYFYIVGYDSCEENPEVVLTNEKHYTDSQFRELCADITVDIYNRRREIFKDNYEYADKHNAEMQNELDEDEDTPQEVIDGLTYDPNSKFENLIDKVIEILIDKHGFKNLTYSAKFIPFGWAKFVPKNDWSEYTEGDKDLIAIRSKIK